MPVDPNVHINTVTAATGAVIKLGPMVTAPPGTVVEDEQLAVLAEGSGLNAPFLADLLAACITHERDGVNLFWMLAATTQNPMLQGKYKQMVGEAEQASGIWARLIRELGGNEQYVSPPARLTEMMDSKVVEAFQGTGSADPLSVEMAGVQATLMAAALCVANAQAVTQLAQDANGQAGQMMSVAAQELTAMADKHHQWAMETMSAMISTQAKHPIAQKMGQAMETAVGKIKDALH